MAEQQPRSIFDGLAYAQAVQQAYLRAQNHAAAQAISTVLEAARGDDHAAFAVAMKEALRRAPNEAAREAISTAVAQVRALGAELAQAREHAAPEREGERPPVSHDMSHESTG